MRNAERKGWRWCDFSGRETSGLAFELQCAAESEVIGEVQCDVMLVSVVVVAESLRDRVLASLS